MNAAEENKHSRGFRQLLGWWRWLRPGEIVPKLLKPSKPSVLLHHDEQSVPYLSFTLPTSPGATICGCDKAFKKKKVKKKKVDYLGYFFLLTAAKPSLTGAACSAPCPPAPQLIPLDSVPVGRIVPPCSRWIFHAVITTL